jgi:hypothetical protein
LPRFLAAGSAVRASARGTPAWVGGLPEAARGHVPSSFPPRGRRVPCQALGTRGPPSTPAKAPARQARGSPPLRKTLAFRSEILRDGQRRWQACTAREDGRTGAPRLVTIRGAAVSTATRPDGSDAREARPHQLLPPTRAPTARGPTRRGDLAWTLTLNVDGRRRLTL